MSGRPITGTTRDALRRVLADAYRSGQTLDEVARTYGTSPTTAYRLLLEAGVTMRAPGPRSRTRDSPMTDKRAAP